MEKRMRELFVRVSLLQLRMVEMGVLKTYVETNPTYIKICCVCEDTEQCAAVLALFVKSGLLKPEGIGYIKFDPDTGTYSVDVKID